MSDLQEQIHAGVLEALEEIELRKAEEGSPLLGGIIIGGALLWFLPVFTIISLIVGVLIYGCYSVVGEIKTDWHKNRKGFYKGLLFFVGFASILPIGYLLSLLHIKDLGLFVTIAVCFAITIYGWILVKREWILGKRMLPILGGILMTLMTAPWVLILMVWVVKGAI